MNENHNKLEIHIKTQLYKFIDGPFDEIEGTRKKLLSVLEGKRILSRLASAMHERNTQSLDNLLKIPRKLYSRKDPKTLFILAWHLLQTDILDDAERRLVDSIISKDISIFDCAADFLNQFAEQINSSVVQTARINVIAIDLSIGLEFFLTFLQNIVYNTKVEMELLLYNDSHPPTRQLSAYKHSASVNLSLLLGNSRLQKYHSEGRMRLNVRGYAETPTIHGLKCSINGQKTYYVTESEFSTTDDNVKSWSPFSYQRIMANESFVTNSQQSLIRRFDETWNRLSTHSQSMSPEKP